LQLQLSGPWTRCLLALVPGLPRLSSDPIFVYGYACAFYGLCFVLNYHVYIIYMYALSISSLASSGRLENGVWNKVSHIISFASVNKRVERSYNFF
jgi:hypothetical protein